MNKKVSVNDRFIVKVLQGVMRQSPAWGLTGTVAERRSLRRLLRRVSEGSAVIVAARTSGKRAA